MQFRQLITVLGLGLSHVHAQIDETLITQVVELMTRPDQVLAGLPHEHNLLIKPGEDPALFEHQIHSGLGEALTSLRDVGDHHTSLIVGSIAGYHSTIGSTAPAAVRGQRLKIYRQSIYSRLKDLAQDNPNTSEAHLQDARQRLFLKLQEYVLERHALSHEPMGDARIIKQHEERIVAELKKFRELHGNDLEKMKEYILAHLPSRFELTKLKYLSVDEVNNALRATDGKGYPAAQLIEHIQPTSEKPAHPAAAPVSHKGDTAAVPSHHPVAPVAPSAPVAAAAA